MTIEVSIGSVSSGFPETANELVDRTGFSPASIATWETALAEGQFPHMADMPPFPQPVSRSEADTSHVFILNAGRSASESDASGILTYAYATGSDGSILMGADMVTAWRDGRWWKIAEDPADISAETVASILGKVDSLLIGFSDDLEALAEWGLEDLSGNERGEFLEWIEERSGSGPDPDNVETLPGRYAAVSVYLAHAWGVPTYGPPSPDAASPYHRARLTALRLAAEGYLVTVDWGPLAQTYEWAMDDPDTPRGEVLINTMSAEYASNARGHLPNVEISADSTEVLEVAVAQATTMGALP